METSSLKRFAIEARKLLLNGVKNRLEAIGFMPDGSIVERPQLMSGGAKFMDGIVSEDFYHQWTSLERRFQQVGFRVVAEEGAYTWFNRLMAIRIMSKNKLIPPTLDLDEDLRIPLLVSEARQGRMPEMDAQTRRKLDALLMNDNKTDEQFQLLIVAFCHATPIINRCFGSLQDYTELLLPADILREQGFLPLLNDTDYITDADYRSSELIGWLYQFYNAERKDEVFAKKGKYDADEIAPATQIFTPNWIVKYMVQNTVGRIYLDNNPWDADELKAKWKYLVDPAEAPTEENIFHFTDLEELKFADLSCGSGHIVNEIFDILYDLYIGNGYSPADAIRNIFRCNITGVELDTRAKQLATFALMLKACQKDAQFMDCKTMPRILDMPKLPTADRCMEVAAAYNKCVGLLFGNAVLNELLDAFELMQHADTLGSIMKFSLGDATRQYLATAVEAYDADKFAEYSELIAAYKLMLALTECYSALVMNPPYMGSGKMDDVLGGYVKKHYEEGKADLFSVFMMLAIDRLAPNGKYGMINMQSWMFLSSFEKLRKTILDNYHIENLLHLGPRTFDELSGEVVQNAAFVIGKTAPSNGNYYRLVDGKDCADKERMFLNGEGYCPNVSQQSFEKIPRQRIGYWLSPNKLEAFAEKSIIDVAKPSQGLATGDNNRFLRFWHEISYLKFGKPIKWIPITKGGSFRKWYGNMEYVVNWENDGAELKAFKNPQTGKLASRPQNQQFYFKSIGCTWSTISSGKASFRYFDKGWLFETKGSVCFPNDESNNNVIMGYLNSALVNPFLEVFSPTMDYHEGPVGELPYKEIQSKPIDNLVAKNIAISKQDWDAHETSWDFAQNELIALNNNEAYTSVVYESAEQDGCVVDLAPAQLGNLAWLIDIYKLKWETKFEQLHKNEEELNRQFIDIYGLQDELSPDVPLDEITILQQGEISIE